MRQDFGVVRGSTIFGTNRLLNGVILPWPKSAQLSQEKPVEEPARLFLRLEELAQLIGGHAEIIKDGR